MIETLKDFSSAVCPRCGEDDRFEVDVVVTVRLVGGQMMGQADNARLYEDGSVRCTVCDHRGSESDFEVPYLLFSAAVYRDGVIDDAHELRSARFDREGNLDVTESMTEEEACLRLDVAALPKGGGFRQARIDWFVAQLTRMGATLPGRVFDDDELATFWEAPAYPLDKEKAEWMVKRYILCGLEGFEYEAIEKAMLDHNPQGA